MGETGMNPTSATHPLDAAPAPARQEAAATLPTEASAEPTPAMPSPAEPHPVPATSSRVYDAPTGAAQVSILHRFPRHLWASLSITK
jgi:hypothetical protein